MNKYSLGGKIESIVGVGHECLNLIGVKFFFLLYLRNEQETFEDAPSPHNSSHFLQKNYCHNTYPFP